jgi:hypothetical protein
MKILGIDPGSRITGFGLIEAKKLKFTYLASGCDPTAEIMAPRACPNLIAASGLGRSGRINARSITTTSG